MTESNKRNVLGIMVNAIDYDGTVSSIVDAARNRQGFAVTALAVHGLVTGAIHKSLGAVLNDLDIVTPDGQPIRWALNWLHHARLRERVYGPTLMLLLCQRAAREGLPVYFYGSKLNVVGKLVANMRERWPDLKIAGFAPSLFKPLTVCEKSEWIKTIRASGAEIVFIGLGCPLQEMFVHELRADASCPLIAVGAAFDFHAGLLPQAPGWMQQGGLEWLFRIVHEPARLWKRYLLLNPVFVILLTLQLIGIYRPMPILLPRVDDARINGGPAPK